MIFEQRFMIWENNQREGEILRIDWEPEYTLVSEFWAKILDLRE